MDTEVKKVRTEIFQLELGTNGSYPSIFDCCDGMRYVVKHSQQNRNFRHLINEFIGAYFGKIIELSIPDFALIEINENIIPANYSFRGGKPSGLGFGSLMISNTKTITSINELIELVKRKNNDIIIKDLIKICLFDIWLRNNDRSPNNLNLLLSEIGNQFKLYAIDHSSIFFELDYLSLDREINEKPSAGENLIDKELFNIIYDKMGLFFVNKKKEICEKISELSNLTIKSMLDLIPSEWNLSEEEKSSIFNFINVRKSILEKQFDILLKEIGL